MVTGRAFLPPPLPGWGVVAQEKGVYQNVVDLCVARNGLHVLCFYR